MDTTQCESTTKAGARCKKTSVSGSSRCGLHKDRSESPENVVTKKCITVTFSDVVENGVGMEKIGTEHRDIGIKFTPEYLAELHLANKDSRLIDLSRNEDKACVLVLSNFCDNADDILSELLALDTLVVAD